MGNGDNFAQDVTEDQPMNGTSENGQAEAAQDNGSAEAPGRDDDRYPALRRCGVRRIGVASTPTTSLILLPFDSLISARVNKNSAASLGWRAIDSTDAPMAVGVVDRPSNPPQSKASRLILPVNH